MLYLSYDKPIDQRNLPALSASFDRLKLRLRRRRILSGVCGCLCFLLFTALMILGSVGAFHRFAGAEYAAALDSLPHVKEILTGAFQTLPALLGLKLALPEFVCIGVAVILPPLLCLPIALLLRQLLRLGKKPAPEDRSAEALLQEVRELSERSKKSRKANWTLLSGLLILAAFAAAVVYSLVTVKPVSEEWDLKFILSYLFIAAVGFSVFQLLATLTDKLLELFCGLDAQWDGSDLIEDLEAFLAGEKPAPSEPAPQAAPAESPAAEEGAP